MGAAMYFQQKLNPAPPDPMQAKVMQFLPVMFTGMFAFFPGGPRAVLADKLRVVDGTAVEN